MWRLISASRVLNMAMNRRRLAGIYAAIEREPGGKTVSCSGIVTFNKEGRISKEMSGGNLIWKTAAQSDKEVKQLIRKRVEGTLAKSAGVTYEVDDDRIFLVDKRTYRRILKKAESEYSSWLARQHS